MQVNRPWEEMLPVRCSWGKFLNQSWCGYIVDTKLATLEELTGHFVSFRKDYVHTTSSETLSQTTKTGQPRRIRFPLPLCNKFRLLISPHFYALSFNPQTSYSWWKWSKCLQFLSYEQINLSKHTELTCQAWVEHFTYYYTILTKT